MEGIKSDRPEFIHRVFRQLVEDIKNDDNPIPKLKEALYQDHIYSNSLYYIVF